MTNEPKKFLSLDEQIDYLINDKLISFKDKDSARFYLLNHNYFNVISSGKLKHATNYLDKKHHYANTSFDSWIEFYNNDLKLSKQLRNNVIELEQLLNSRTAYYVAELIEVKKIKKRKIQGLIQIIKFTKEIPGFSFLEYENVETWKFINKMPFGDLKRVLIWLYSNEVDIYNKIVQGISYLSSKKGDLEEKISETVNLRNKIMHNTPLSIYLAYANFSQKGGMPNNNIKKSIVKSIYSINPECGLKEELWEMCKLSSQMMRMKAKKRPTN